MRVATASLILSLWLAPASAQDVRRDATVQAVEAAGPAVANIATEQLLEPRGGGYQPPDEWFADRSARGAQRVVTHLGSGAVIDPDGYVLTNAHVVARASRIMVMLPGRPELEAQLLSLLPEHDLALLKVESPDPLPALRLAAPGDVYMGETCVALGNPFGLENTVTRGVVSARGRRLQVDGRPLPVEFLQTDAAVNPGNSGGPLINLDAELIGINTAVHSSGQGIGFAIPVEVLRGALASLSDPLLLRDRYLGLDLSDAAEDGGATVVGVDPAGPGFRAGLQPGDVIVSAGPDRVTSAFGFHERFLEEEDPGEVRLAVLRNGERRGATLTAAAPPYRQALADRLGILGRDLTPALAWRLRLQGSGGVRIDRVQQQGPAHAIGVEPGDVIVGLARSSGDPRLGHQREAVRVRSSHDVWRFLQACSPGEAIGITVSRAGRQFTGELEPR